MTLIDLPTYRSMSGDTTSIDSAVTAALATAQQLLEESLRRGFVDHNPLSGTYNTWISGLEFMSRTEIVMLHPDGRSYPIGIPIGTITNPLGVVIRDDAVLGLWPQQNPLWDILYEPYRYGPGGGGGDLDTTAPIATITYSGGYTPATLPRKLRQAIVDLAKVEMTIFDPTLAGVKSAMVGDTSVVYADAPDRAGVTAAILDEVRGFRWREIGH